MDKRVQFNLKAAEERLRAAKKLLDDNFIVDSINRSYYAIFYSTRALVAKDEQDFSKHSAVISYFRRNYIKTGIFDKKFSKYIGDAFVLRNDGDYTYFFEVDKTDAEIQYNNAVEFFEEIKKFLEEAEQ